MQTFISWTEEFHGTVLSRNENYTVVDWYIKCKIGSALRFMLVVCYVLHLVSWWQCNLRNILVSDFQLEIIPEWAKMTVVIFFIVAQDRGSIISGRAQTLNWERWSGCISVTSFIDSSHFEQQQLPQLNHDLLQHQDSVLVLPTSSYRLRKGIELWGQLQDFFWYTFW